MKKKRFIKFLERYLKEKLNKDEKHQTQLKEKVPVWIANKQKKRKTSHYYVIIYNMVTFYL